MSSQSETEFGRITFEFETVCTADCELYFMMVGTNGIRQARALGFAFLPVVRTRLALFFQDVNRKSTTVVESWEGSKTRQSYTHVMAKNASVSYTWAFQRTNHPSDVSTKSFSLNMAFAGCNRVCFCFPLFSPSQLRKRLSDVARIYAIWVSNAVDGLSSGCRACALSSQPSSSGCVPCPAGHYIDTSTSQCTECPPNTYLVSHATPSPDACKPCGPASKSDEVGHTSGQLF